VSWGVALRSWATGVGGWLVDDDNAPAGFGGAAARASDQPRGTWPGDVTGVDVPGATTGTVGVIGGSNDPADAPALAETLRAAWHASSTTDEAITITRGSSVRSYYGRPNGCTVDEQVLALGAVRALCSFRVLDPYGYGAAVTVTGVGSSLTVSGTATTDRVVWTITGNGGVPSIANTTTAETLLFGSAVAGAATRVVNVRNRTVVDGVGASAMGGLAVATSWPRLAPGVNTLTITGCASVDVTYLPAYP